MKKLIAIAIIAMVLMMGVGVAGAGKFKVGDRVESSSEYNKRFDKPFEGVIKTLSPCFECDGEIATTQLVSSRHQKTVNTYWLIMSDKPKASGLLIPDVFWPYELRHYLKGNDDRILLWYFMAFELINQKSLHFRGVGDSPQEAIDDAYSKYIEFKQFTVGKKEKE